MMIVQGLGRKDAELIRLEGVWPPPEGECRDLTSLMFESALWVLGAYELTRTICQLIEDGRWVVPPDVAEAFVVAKRELNRIRVPLAKWEPAASHRRTDRSYAPADILPSGLGWSPAPGDSVSRLDLSDRLLSALELAHSRVGGVGQLNGIW